jgi:AraC-like DNA-binding protein
MPQTDGNSGTTPACSTNGLAGFRISTDGRPPSHRLPAINRGLEQTPFGTQIDVLSERPLQGMVIWRSLPGLDFMWARSSPIATKRSGPVLAHGSDSILFTTVNTPRIFRVFGKEDPSEADEGLAVGNAGPGGSIYPSPHRQVTVIVPQKSMAASLRERSAHFVHRLPPNSAAMQLLVGYLDVLKDAPIPRGLEQSVVSHVHDLLAVALGATSDGLEIALRRGVRAARLRAIKKDAIGNLDGKLSIGAVAARHRLTPRYVQMLFEEDGTTFTAFVREQRLLRARAMLASPRFDHLQIGEIAFDVGFGDLSYFIRIFSRRFGMSPGEAREGEALGEHA